MDNRILWTGLLIVVFLAAFGSDYLFNNEEEVNDVGNNYTYVGSLGTYDFKVNPQGDHFLNWSLTYMTSPITQEVRYHLTPYPYGPMDLIDIPLQDFRAQFEIVEMIYITRDIELDTKTGSEIVVSLLSLDRLAEKYKKSENVWLAVIEENDKSREMHLPLMTCEDANPERMVIWLKEGTENKIYRQGDYCVVGEFIEGDDPNKVATKIAYHLIGVM
jgi:hypothetical protein